MDDSCTRIVFLCQCIVLVYMSVEGLRSLALSLDYDYTDFVNYRVKFWGRYKGIDLSYLKLDEIPTELYSVSDIRVLNIMGNNLHNLWDKDKSDFSFLRVLRADDNPFQFIPAEVFELPNLRELYLDNCGISIIDNNLQRLLNLRTISLQSNKLNEFPTFEKVDRSSLQILHLGDNALKYLPLGQSFLDSLEILKVEQNNLSQFPDTSLNEKLWMIDLKGNPISNINPNELNSRIINSLSFSIENPDLLTTELIARLLDINQVIIEIQSEDQFAIVEQKILRLARLSDTYKIVYFNPSRSELIISNLRRNRFF